MADKVVYAPRPLPKASCKKDGKEYVVRPCIVCKQLFHAEREKGKKDRKTCGESCAVKEGHNTKQNGDRVSPEGKELSSRPDSLDQLYINWKRKERAEELRFDNKIIDFITDFKPDELTVGGVTFKQSDC
jgi:hypothetical protein